MRARVSRRCVVLAGLGLLVAACGPQASVSRCSPSAQPAARPVVPVVFVGEPVELEVVLPPAVFCQGGNPVATSVTTDVFDAQNQPVTHTHDGPRSSNTSGYETTVRFTPLRRGTYLVTARFEPALGVTQRLVQVVDDRTGAPPLMRFAVPDGCEDAAAFEGHVLCRRRGVVSVWSGDGGLVERRDAVGLLATGRAGWLWGDAGVTRYFVRDGGLVRDALDVDPGDGAHGASEDRLISASGGEVREVFATATGLEVRRWTHDAGSVLGPAVALAGDVVGLTTAFGLCSVVADGGTFCVPSQLVPGAADGRALWLRGAETGVVGLARFAPTLQEPTVLFLAGQSVALTDTKQPRPFFTWTGRLVTIRADDLSLEAWRAPALAERRWVTPEHLLFQLAASSELVVFAR
ncbi:MAG: hypothetical protein ACOZQL_07815 [Myxococcota bacterium]